MASFSHFLHHSFALCFPCVRLAAFQTKRTLFTWLFNSQLGGEVVDSCLSQEHLCKSEHSRLGQIWTCCTDFTFSANNHYANCTSFFLLISLKYWRIFYWRFLQILNWVLHLVQLVRTTFWHVTVNKILIRKLVSLFTLYLLFEDNKCFHLYCSVICSLKSRVWTDSF